METTDPTDPPKDWRTSGVRVVRAADSASEQVGRGSVVTMVE